MPPIHQVGARLRAAARALVRGPPGASPGFPASIPGGALDEVLITRSGHIEVVGWSESEDGPGPLDVTVNGVAARRCGAFRLARPDVLAALPLAIRLPGFVQRLAAATEIDRIDEV